MQFIEDNLKFIVDETEPRKEDNTTSALYLDKKYYPCVVLSESGSFCQYFSFIIRLVVYICHKYYSQQKIHVKVQPKQLPAYLFKASLVMGKRRVILASQKEMIRLKLHAT